MFHSRLYFIQLVYLLVFTGPFVFLILKSFFATSLEDIESWNFIVNTTLPSLITNTGSLIIITTTLSLLIGFYQGILTTLSNIPFKKYLHILFILPLAYPLYVISYIYVGMFEYGGDIATFLRENFLIDLNHYFSIKSIFAIALIFSLVLSPYCYLFFRSFLLRIDQKTIWSARSLGLSPVKVLTNLIIPQAKPWIFGAGILVILEVLCDFGGVSIFNFETFTVAIYQAWIDLFSINTAIKLSIIPIIFALLLYYIDQRINAHQLKRENRKEVVLFKFTKMETILTYLILVALFSLSLFIPLSVLFYWVSQSLTLDTFFNLSSYIMDTFLLGLLGSLMTGLFALIYLGWERFQPHCFKLCHFFKLGYAIPGVVVAIALMSLLSSLEINYFGIYALIAVSFALAIRFFAPIYNLQDKSYQLINHKVDWSSRSLGVGKLATFLKIHIPLLKPAILSSFLLCFLEIIKEMPITLILRPHGIDTLATKIYGLTSEGEWEQTAIYALTLFLFGALSLFITSRQNNHP